MSKNLRHLIRQFKPTNYQLSLHPDRDNMKFSGSVVISGKKLGQPTKRITLHQKDLKISKATITKHTKKGDEDIPVTRINNHKSYDEVRLHVAEPIYPADITILLEFSGSITRAMNGIYPCFFKDEGVEKKLIATQFESHHAREVFPCVDEPAAKATFDLTLNTPKGEVAISNTPVAKTTTKGSTTTTTFEQTPIMSTYLLAFVYGELGFTEAKTKRGTHVRIYATPDKVDLTDFALDFATKCLDFYESYFGIPYPLQKCDHIALPDFASGAMENWGCITYREQALLIDEAHSPLVMKQRVATVIAHELAHQWFGNLVTMRWWTDLWLNEGFASWIEFLAVDEIFPDWHIWTQFVVDEQQQGMRLDALENTHPVEVPIDHPDEIRSIFDTISYSKGASVIHMLHGYLGAEAFQAGLKHYLTTYSYKNTDTVDLWKSLEEISGKPVMEFMHAWTSQSGFPVVHATVDESSVTLDQERFTMNHQSTQQNTPLWPITLLSSEEQLAEKTLTSAKETHKLGDTDHFLLNLGRSGFYRVVYNTAHLQKIGERIKKGQLGETDRLGILADITEAAKAGEGSTADVLTFLENFAHESDYAVWDTIASTLGSVRLVMNDEAVSEGLKPFTRKLVAGELDRLGWEKQNNESHFDSLLRPIILGMAAISEEPDTLQRIHELFAAIPEPKPGTRRSLNLDPDLRGIIFSTSARHGDVKTFDKLLSLHDSAHLSDEKVSIAAALCSFRQPELIDRALQTIKTDAVRLQDIPYWIAYSFVNRHARTAAWEWLKQNWEWLEKETGNDLSFFRTPIYVARVQSDSEFIQSYRNFFEPKLSPALERSYKQGLEMLNWQSAWKDRDLQEVVNFLKSHQ